MSERPIEVLAVCHASRDNLNVYRPEAAQIAGVHNSARANVTVLCNPGAVTIPYFKQQGIRVLIAPLEKKLSVKTIVKIRTELQQGSYDILHLFNNTAISNGAFAALFTPVKVVAYRGQTGNTSRWNPFSYLSILHPRIDMVIGVANAVTNYVRSQQWGRDKAATVYKGHDLAWYQGSPANLSSLRLPNDAVIVSLVADIRPRKGLHVLIAATHHFAPSSNLHILLVGAEPDDTRVRAEIAKAADPSRIHALGYRKDAPEVSAASDLIVLPTTKREGLSRAILEAMSYARPAVVTDTGGNAELVADEESGLVVPPNDPLALAQALNQLAQDASQREIFGNAARQRVEQKFSVAQGVEQTLAIYEKLLR